MNIWRGDHRDRRQTDTGRQKEKRKNMLHQLSNTCFRQEIPPIQIRHNHDSSLYSSDLSVQYLLRVSETVSRSGLCDVDTIQVVHSFHQRLVDVLEAIILPLLLLKVYYHLLSLAQRVRSSSSSRQTFSLVSVIRPTTVVLSANIMMCVQGVQHGTQYTALRCAILTT